MIMFAFLLLLLLISTVHASIYVTNPIQSSTCTGGESCQVQWTDDGQAPLLSNIGECDLNLYTSDIVSAQSVGSVDVSSTQSFSFTVDASVGPNGQYYLMFTCSAASYTGYSATFTLVGMTGTTPTGGSSTPVPTNTTAGSSTPAGSATPVTTLSGSVTPSTVSGTSTPVVSTITPTTSTTGTNTLTGTTTPSTTLTTPIVSTPSTSATSSPITTTATATVTSSTTASATASSAAGRVGSSISFGGIAAMFVLSGVLAL